MEKDGTESKKIDRRKITTPQNSQGGKVSIIHGGYSFLASGLVPCDKCLFKSNGCSSYTPGGDCAIIKAYREEKIKELMALPWLQNQKEFIGTVDNYVKLRCFSLVIEKWISRAGLFTIKKGKLDAQPIMKVYGIFLNAQERIADKLFLSPMAQKLAGISKADETLQDHLNKMMEVKDGDDSKDGKEEG